MQFSYIALNRVVEEQAAQDASYRRKLEKTRRPFLSHGRSLLDDELLAKLRQLGIDAQPRWLVDNFPNFVSAEVMSNALVDCAETEIPDAEVDWVWIAITCLWERWQSNLPNMEMVDDKMQAGYAALNEGDPLQACRLWLETWRGILDIIDRAGMDSLDEFDDQFRGTQRVFNWVQDFESELHNAGMDEPRFFHERISLCEMMLDRFSNGRLTVDNFKAALAESHFELGNGQTGNSLFRGWLEKTPQWGSGWIAWSDCYWLFSKDEHKNALRAEQILHEGLATPGVENRLQILERLLNLYEETGKDREAVGVRAELEQARKTKAATTVRFTPAPQAKPRSDFVEDELSHQDLPLPALRLHFGHSVDGGSFGGKHRVGRNESCPCGSGKKYKKCCARKTGANS